MMIISISQGWCKKELCLENGLAHSRCHDSVSPYIININDADNDSYSHSPPEKFLRK